MKKLLLPLFAFLLFTACETDPITNSQLDQQLQENNDETSKSSNQKIDVCHKGQIINISINAVAAHQAHGDAVDMDGDGFFDIDNPCSETDCDDTDATVNPGATEVIYDGIDNDCNPETLDDDLDQDGFNNDDDCDDTDATVNPGATEICGNGIDDNCNGEIDENCIVEDPCLQAAINAGEAFINNLDNTQVISTTITGSTTFTVYFQTSGGGRGGPGPACYINKMEATGTPGNCGFTFSTHELVDCP